MSINDLLKRMEEERNSDKSWEEVFLEKFHEAHLSVETKNAQPIPRDYTRPSSLGGCKRKVFYMRTGAPQDEPILDKNKCNSMGILESGTDRHARIQAVVQEMDNLGFLKVLDLEEVIKETGVDTEFLHWNEDHTEARMLNKELGIYFQPDGCIEMNGIRALLEIKTCGNSKWDTIRKRTIPFPEHLTQATAYAMGVGLDYVCFIYEHRDDTARHIMLVKISEDTKELVKGKLMEIEGFIKNGELPPREVKHCYFCEYKQKCNADEF